MNKAARSTEGMKWEWMLTVSRAERFSFSMLLSYQLRV